MDLLLTIDNIAPWLQKKSVKEVEELNDEVFAIYNLLGMPVVVCFVDLDSNADSNDIVQ